MLPDLKETADEQALEVLEHRRSLSSHYVYVLLSELEWCLFKAKVARRVLEVEAKVNVYQVALRVDQYVSIVSVLHVEQVREDGVPGQTLNEVLLSSFKVISEVLLVKRTQSPIFVWKLFLQVVN
jgi:hypothetical protein